MKKREEKGRGGEGRGRGRDWREGVRREGRGKIDRYHLPSPRVKP